ncbi:MAG: response regulator [Candidatus Rokubacteria bacterium]|nr:response regulator [Candidatus Rokubacteria bacterium]
MDKKRILLIDDEPSFTRMLRLNLERTGTYEVREENRGAQGLAAAREFKPDLILLDVIMPDADGGTVAAQIKADQSLKNTPVVFLTAVVTKKEEGVIGGRPFIAKPVSANEVIGCIEKHLAR